MKKRRTKIVSGDFYTDVKRLLKFGWQRRGTAKNKAKGFGSKIFKHMRR